MYAANEIAPIRLDVQYTWNMAEPCRGIPDGGEKDSRDVNLLPLLNFSSESWDSVLFVVS